MKIELVDLKEIIRMKPTIHLPVKEFKQQIDEILEKGLILPSSSPHSLPASMFKNQLKKGESNNGNKLQGLKSNH